MSIIFAKPNIQGFSKYLGTLVRNLRIVSNNLSNVLKNSKVKNN